MHIFRIACLACLLLADERQSLVAEWERELTSVRKLKEFISQNQDLVEALDSFKTHFPDFFEEQLQRLDASTEVKQVIQCLSDLQWDV